ncbi:MAG TPA: hypothetical protein VEG39_17740 [Clostridia bacterium]|nr:hypothetical protein [Clostridia bacterium]
MKIIDNMPIIIIVTALMANIAIGIKNGIGFSALMIRCIIVTIVFGVFGYMLTETVKKAIECSNLSKLTNKKGAASVTADGNNLNESKTTLDIKVPPLDDKELMDMDSDSDNGFVEVNPVRMRNYGQSEQD